MEELKGIHLIEGLVEGMIENPIIETRNKVNEIVRWVNDQEARQKYEEFKVREKIEANKIRLRTIWEGSEGGYVPPKGFKMNDAQKELLRGVAEFNDLYSEAIKKLGSIKRAARREGEDDGPCEKPFDEIRDG